MHSFKVLVFLFFSFVGKTKASSDASNSRLNLLFILVDDLQAASVIEKQDAFSTPNFDQLRNDGVVFENSYSSIALCGPSRLSLLTGRSPSDLGYFLNGDNQYGELAALRTSQSLPRWFHDQGYNVQGLGKLFHWKETSFSEFGGNFIHSPVHLEPACRKSRRISCFVPRKTKTTDYDMVERAVNYLEYAKSNNLQQPFALFIGIRRPHLKYAVPQTQIDSISMKDDVMPNLTWPEGRPWQAWYPIPPDMDDAEDILELGHIPGTSIKPKAGAYTRHLYFAAVRFVDSLLGILLDAVDRLDLRSNTVVVLTSDHGYALGEGGHWGKGTMMNYPTRVPLFVRDPLSTIAPGSRKLDLFESVNLFPTVAGLAGVPLDEATQQRFGLSGKDRRSLLRESNGTAPDDGQKYPWSYPANSSFSLWPICSKGSAPTVPIVCTNDYQTKRKFSYMGYSIRTGLYRYTEWRPWRRGANEADWSIYGEDKSRKELYLLSDTSDHNNIISNASPTLTSSLGQMLRTRFATCLPKASRAHCLSLGGHCTFTKDGRKFRCHLKSDCTLKTRKACTVNAACAWGVNGCYTRPLN